MSYRSASNRLRHPTILTSRAALPNPVKQENPQFMPRMNFNPQGDNLWQALVADIFKTKQQPKKDLNYDRFRQHFTLDDIYKDDFHEITEFIQRDQIRKRKKEEYTFQSEGRLMLTQEKFKQHQTSMVFNALSLLTITKVSNPDTHLEQSRSARQSKIRRSQNLVSRVKASSSRMMLIPLVHNQMLDPGSPEPSIDMPESSYQINRASRDPR